MDVSHSIDLLLSDLSVLLAPDKSDNASSKHYIEYILYSMDICYSTDLLLSDLTVELALDKSDNAFFKLALYRIHSTFYGYQSFV